MANIIEDDDEVNTQYDILTDSITPTYFYPIPSW